MGCTKDRAGQFGVYSCVVAKRRLIVAAVFCVDRQISVSRDANQSRFALVLTCEASRERVAPERGRPTQAEAVFPLQCFSAEHWVGLFGRQDPPR